MPSGVRLDPGEGREQVTGTVTTLVIDQTVQSLLA